ncbi:MAG: asparagine synthase C-terminal domain-containing protein, partial [Deinococcus sp.]|nr:asparagine synthase C-terminal domain-containing protein [Deinococcus sp.]
LLRDAYRDQLPREVIRGAKRGFEIPLARWLQGPLAEVVGDTLGSPAARVRTYYEDKEIKALLEGRSYRERNRAYLVYALLVLELWLREEEAR